MTKAQIRSSCTRKSCYTLAEAQNIHVNGLGECEHKLYYYSCSLCFNFHITKQKPGLHREVFILVRKLKKRHKAYKHLIFLTKHKVTKYKNKLRKKKNRIKHEIVVEYYKYKKLRRVA